MILGALASYYERLAEDRERRHVPPIGYSYENISYVLILNLDGSPVRLEPWQDTSNRKPRPKREVVPLTERTSGVKAKFLWDNSSYIFGRSSKSKRCEREHNNFKQLHERLLEGTDDPGLKALLCYLRRWRPECLDTLPGAESILGEENANIIFRLDSDIPFLHAQEAAKEIWSRNFGKDNVSPGVCLVSGDHTLIANIHPVIKGIRDAQTRGACIVSFNANAFTSFGKEGGANAPVEANRVYAYTLALNYLLAEARQRAQIADATTVFWAEADFAEVASKLETIFGCALSDHPRSATENANAISLLDEISKGRPLDQIDPPLADDKSRFHVLGLSPNAARIAIRFWESNTFSFFADNLRQHYLDLRIRPLPWKTPPSVWRLLLQTAPQRKSENVPPALAGAVMRAILTGQPYPHTLFGQIIARVRADHDVNGLRAGILKACLVRRYRQIQKTEQEVIYLVSLDRNERNAAYRLGRLFALLEITQRATLGDINSTIRDRFYASASVTPAAVFPSLLRNSKNHLANLRRGRTASWVKSGPKLGWWLDKEMEIVLEGVGPSFPRTFSMDDQGRFAIGYYHQRFASVAPGEAQLNGQIEHDEDEILT